MMITLMLLDHPLVELVSSRHVRGMMHALVLPKQMQLILLPIMTIPSGVKLCCNEDFACKDIKTQDDLPPDCIMSKNKKSNGPWGRRDRE
jgi:hypothetical protein